MRFKHYFRIITYLLGCIPFLGFTQKVDSLVDFVTATTNAGIDILSIKNQSTISRYEVTRILNAVECKDCINPSNNFINKYSKDYRSLFKELPGKDFDEIDYQGAKYKGKSYYYCVASVADNQYMFGYPILSSPACPGLFCGEKETTNAEFIQVIINILSNYIASNYKTNWSTIKKRKDGLIGGSYPYNVLTNDDRDSIDTLSSSCTSNSCTIENGEQFRTYLKYCMFNLKECNMQTMGWIKQGYWPIAEINIAYKEGLIEKINYLINNIHQPINGDYAISILSRTFPKISCTFDKDGDGILDDKDNCINIPNPDQKDTNKNGIGDLCEGNCKNDKDCDGILDDKDNCIDTPNPDQKDTNKNGIGDLCEGNCKNDKDCDGILDKDNCLITNTLQSDKNNNGIGDLCENDKDKCSILINPLQADKNRNGIADACEFCKNDEDCDGILDDKDNCRFIYNPDQKDTNNNGIGDLCEENSKNCLIIYNPKSLDNNKNGIVDNCENDKDNCIDTPNPDQKDTNNNGIGDLCENDKDCDGITNEKDNCPNSYNPNQKDTDNDGLGDVCDNDIDGDGMLNPIGIVDAGGAVNIKLLDSGSIDNCIDTPNPDQKDTNNNSIGDLCDLNNKGGLAIESRIIGSGSNRKIFSTIVSSGEVKNIQRTIEHNNKKQNYQGNSILHIINSSGGVYKISAESLQDPSQKASQTITINKYNKVSNAEIILSTSKQFLPFILDASIQGSGEGNTVEWEIDGPITQTINKTKNEKRSLVIKNPGEYTIKGVIKDQGIVTAIAQRSFHVDTISTNLYSINKNISNISMNTPLIFSINFPINKRVIERGDGSMTDGFSSLISHSYKTPGTFIMSSKIILPNDKIIQEYRTIVIHGSEGEDKILNTRPEITQGGINQMIKRYNKQSFINKSIENIYYNGITYSNTENKALLLFNEPGIYYPKQTKILKQCQIVETQSTLIINDNTNLSCLSLSKLKLKPQCDTDKDGIDDRCDDDIDGDGVKNLIGLIKYNNPSCTFTKDNVDVKKLYDHIQRSCSLDNCPRTINENQNDNNNTGIGDVCKNIINTGWININTLTGNKEDIKITNNDNDGDGIINSQDLCPNIKENYNGYQDKDGCPEIGNENPCETITTNNYTIGIGDCRQCPCQYADDGNEIKSGDKIRASLWDIGSSILQSRSEIKFLP